MLRLWRILGPTLVISLWALPALAEAPAPDWTLINTQTIRYFLPDPASPPGSSTGDPSRADPAGDPEWNLVATERVKYFVADGGEVEERLLSRTTENRVVAAGRTHEADSSRQPRQSPVYEAPRTSWSRESFTHAPQGRFMVTTGTYKVPRYRDVENPWVEIDHFKRQSRVVSQYSVTVRSKILAVSGGEPIPGDSGTTRVETREGPWTDQGGVDPTLDKVAARGYESPVPHLVDYTTRSLEEARRPFVADAQTSAAAVSNTGLPGFSTGSARGASGQARAGRDAVASRRLAGSSDAKAKGGGSFESPFAGLGSEFWGRSGSKALFRFKLAEQGGGKLLTIFPVDANGRVVEASGAAWALDAKGTMPTQTLSTAGLAATMSDAHRTGGGVRITGTFRNKITGQSADSLTLSDR